MDDIRNDDRVSNDSGCPDVSTEENVDDTYNSISFQTFSSRPNDDTTYNHIANGPIRAIATDNTYAHIPNTKAATFDNTYSHMSNQNSRPEQDNVIETEDSPYNHLGEPTTLAAVTRRNDNGLSTVKTSDGLTDDTYSHINASSNAIQDEKLRTDYEDTTYNHLGDIPTVSTSKCSSYGQGPKIGQNTNDVTEHTNDNRKAVAGYNYAVVNKQLQATKPAFRVDDAPHDYFVLEPTQKTTATPKPYDYTVVNKMSFPPEADSVHEDGPHEYYVLETAQSKATKP